MPYTSRLQMRWAHTARGLKALGGRAKVAEWDSVTRGMTLPERARKRRRTRLYRRLMRRKK